MTKSSFALFLLSVRIAVRRPIIVAFITGAVIGLTIINLTFVAPEIKNRITNLRSAVENDLKLNKSLPSDGGVEAKPLSDFYKILGDQNRKTQYVTELFAAAKSMGLELGRVDYKNDYEAEGEYWRYTVSFPVKGRFGDIKSFIEKNLLDFPFVALNEAAFQRRSSMTQEVNAKLSFTFFLYSNQDGQTSAAIR
jgi:hypothetical protein